MKLPVQNQSTYVLSTTGTTTSFLIRLVTLHRLNYDMTLLSHAAWDYLAIYHPTQVLTMKQTRDHLHAIHQHHQNLINMTDSLWGSITT